VLTPEKAPKTAGLTDDKLDEILRADRA